jgi:hypothetical protein
LGIEHFGDAALTHFATELSSDKAALLRNLDSSAATARVPGSRFVEEVIIGVYKEFEALGRPDAQKALVILAGGPPEDSPFEKAWLLKEKLNCTVLVITPQPSVDPAKRCESHHSFPTRALQKKQERRFSKEELGGWM